MSIAKTIESHILQNEAVAARAKDMKVAGEDLWNIDMDVCWDGIGALNVRSAKCEDVSALKDFLTGLSENSLFLFAPYPVGDGLEEALKGTLEACEKGESIIYHAWHEGRIIGHCFLVAFKKDVPDLGIAIADEFHGRKLGHLFMSLLIGAAHTAGKKGIELTTNPKNKAGFHLYQKMGFVHTGDIDITIADGSHRVEHELIYTIADKD